MPQIIVAADRGAAFGEGVVTFRERVNVADFESGHFAAQLVERLGWAVEDADRAEQASDAPEDGDRAEQVPDAPEDADPAAQATAPREEATPDAPQNATPGAPQNAPQNNVPDATAGPRPTRQDERLSAPSPA